MVITSEGLFQAYNIDLETGGECTLIKEFTWVAPTNAIELTGRMLGSEDTAATSPMGAS